MESDSDHSVIEKKRKRYPCPIEHPRDWINLVRLCGTKRPFLVTEMSRTDFFEFSSLYKTILQQRKVSESGEKVSWKEMKWFRYISETFHDFYKNLNTKEDIPNTLPNIDTESDEEEAEKD
nr:unnamed protein product [Callosobruchus chinensis]